MRRLTLRKVAILVGLMLISFGLGKFFDSRCEGSCLASEGKTAIKNAKDHGFRFNFGGMNVNADDIELDDGDCDGKGCTAITGEPEDDVARPVLPDLKGVQDIEIKTVSTEVHVGTTSEEVPKLEIQGVRKGSNWKFLRNDTKLTIEIKGKNPPESLTLNIPKSYKGNLSVNTVSGVQNVEKDVVAKTISLQTVSGDVLLSASPSEKLSINSVSGEVQAEIDTAAQVKVLDINNVSGDIKVFLKSPFQTLKTQTVSGEVAVNVPANVPFSYDLHSMSGDFQGLPAGADAHEGIADHSAKGNVGQGATSGKIRFESVSGDFNLTRDAG